jgi:Peptidase family C25
MATNDQSIKLSVTVKRRFEAKYKDPRKRKRIDDARQKWIDADAKRGIQTMHVAVDDSADPNLKALGVSSVSGEITANKIKQVIDDLWAKITPTPHYLVLFGAHDIVPMFEVENPTFDFNGDTDKTVLTDNPYASYQPFSANWHSYVYPDRVIGRIPDMLGDPDAAWFVEYLKTATKWKPKPASLYKRPYAICTAEAKRAGEDVMLEAFANSTLPLFICPPISDTSAPARHRLSARLHAVKCHGNEGNPAFWGFAESDPKKEQPCPAITSATLRQLPHLTRSTVVATMCCYGAQIFSPSGKTKEWPMASTYLRKGCLGFVGSTKKAWVGLSDIGHADRIVVNYLKNILAGESIGNAFLACKQDYYNITSGRVPGDEDAKTLIEYVLLGDPSIHPVTSSKVSEGELAVQERHQRRLVRAMLATGIRDFLPTRSDGTPAERAMAEDVFKTAQDMIPKDSAKKLKEFAIKPAAVRVKRVNSRLPALPGTAGGPIQRRKSLEYYWSGRRGRGGHKQLCLLKAVTDPQGKVSRASVMYSS